MLGEIPLTVKFRTGIKQDKNVAHKFIPRFATEWGISAMTVRWAYSIDFASELSLNSVLRVVARTITTAALFQDGRLELYQAVC
jgi:tRNA-dihydrouridine synthase